MLGTTRAAGAGVIAFGLIGSFAANAAVTYTPTFIASIGAGTETFTANTGPQLTDYVAQFNIPKFNSALGTLTSLTVTLTGTMNAIGSITNSGAGPAIGANITQHSTVSNNPPTAVNGSFGGVEIIDGSTNGDTFLVFTTSAIGGRSAGTIASGATASNIPLSGIFATQTLTQSSNFDPNLIGLGTFGIAIATGEYTTTGGSGGNLSAAASTRDDLTLAVTYNFIASTSASPVPEPMSLTLIGTGLVGIAAVIRRRNVG